MQLDGRQLDLLFGTLFDITSLLHAGRERAEIFGRVLDCACELLDAETCTLLWIHGGRLHKYKKSRSDRRLRHDQLPDTSAMRDWLERERAPFLGGPGEWHLPVPTERIARGAGSVVCAPLVAKESHLGLLVAVRPAGPSGFDAGHLKILTALANQTAIVLENVELYERLQHEAVTDGLTGVYNYKTLMQTLRTELRRAQRYGHIVTFVMADVDHLKHYNDRFGHLAGSAVLAEVARLLMANCRNTDVVGKYGGDEFAIILPQTGAEGAFCVADRMRAAIEAHTFENVRAGEITCSFGVAAYPHDGREVHELVCVADRRLFQAKREGKNTIVAPVGPPTGARCGEAGRVPASAPAPLETPDPTPS
jgi:diguanylate cyclase (GGDEF)-like protein